MLATLGAWIPRGSDVAIVDVPVHRNVGDLFIFAVASRLLEDLECRIVYRAGVRDYRQSSARRYIRPDTVVIGLGGGNFGDVYPRYQHLRERIVRAFPENRIVILPQTIHFDDPREQERAARVLAAHGDLRIAVRDHLSLENGREFTKHVELLPDVVHALGESWSQASRTGGRGTIFLMRRDEERAGSATSGDHRPIDWPEIFPDLIPKLARTAALMPVAPPVLSSRLHESWSAHARDLLCRALAWMAEVDHLVTDRLHAAILARLAGRPVTLHDNAYGKLAAYYDAWWRQDPAVELRT